MSLQVAPLAARELYMPFELSDSACVVLVSLGIILMAAGAVLAFIH